MVSSGVQLSCTDMMVQYCKKTSSKNATSKLSHKKSVIRTLL